MKNLQINKKACQKLVAISLVTTLAFTQIQTASSVAYASTRQTIGFINQLEGNYKYSIDGKNYTINKRPDGSMIVIEESSKGINKLEMDNMGNVVMTLNDGIMPRVERFQIDKFSGDSLDIDTTTIKNNELKESVCKLEQYFDTIDLGNNSLPASPSKIPTRQDYNNVQTSFITDLEKTNNIKLQEPTKIEHKRGIFSPKVVNAATPAAINPNDVVNMGICVSGGSAFLDGLIIAGGSVASTGILLTAGLLIGTVALGCVIYHNHIYWVETKDHLINDYTTTIFKALTLEEAKEMGYSDVRDVVADLTHNLEDENPDNDFFKAYMIQEGLVVIDFTRPLSKEEAVLVISSMVNRQENIYTLSPFLADSLIRSANGVPGTSNGKLEYIGRGENHAYVQSYKAFNPITKTIDKSLLVENDKEGIYYWHYHFNGKKLNDGQFNNKHTWFGLPKIKIR